MTAAKRDQRRGHRQRQRALGRSQFAPDSRRVGFGSAATDLVPGAATNGTFDAFVRDLASGTTTLVSARADGARVFFTSSAGDMGPPDTNQRQDVYVASK